MAGRGVRLGVLAVAAEDMEELQGPQLKRPSTTTAAIRAATNRPRRLGGRIRGYELPVTRYFPPIPEGVSMLMSAA